MKKLIAILAVALLAGCTISPTPPSINAQVYNTENLIADTAKAATHVFNIQYHTALLGTNPPPNVIQMNATRDTFYKTDEQLSASLQLVDTLRIQTVATASTNWEPVFAALTTAQAQVSTLNSLTNLISTLK